MMVVAVVLVSMVASPMTAQAQPTYRNVYNANVDGYVGAYAVFNGGTGEGRVVINCYHYGSLYKKYGPWMPTYGGRSYAFCNERVDTRGLAYSEGRG